MPVESAKIESRARAATATISFLAEGSFVNRRFVGPGIEVNTGEYRSHEVMIRDARPIREHFTLDSHGFVLLDHRSAVTDFFNSAQVDALYADEVVAAIRTHTGADCVAPMGWMIRTSGDLGRYARKTVEYQHQGGVQPPAGEAHVDSSPDRADALARSLYERLFPGRPPYRRFLYCSFWRTFSPGPQDCPLALCDGRTVDDREGTTNTLHVVDALPSREDMLRPMPDEAGKPAAAIFRYNPDWRWWYFSNMTRDEALLFKFHDSTRRRPWRVPHTAFRDTSLPGARIRESIEFRSVAYFL
ncbi:MAG: hypothetical protein IT480_02905 [Gammaproteobacteria bacterium]|nr:hypothetical protein [Gammaproteobacteria bacterium]